MRISTEPGDAGFDTGAALKARGLDVRVHFNGRETPNVLTADTIQGVMRKIRTDAAGNPLPPRTGGEGMAGPTGQVFGVETLKGRVSLWVGASRLEEMPE